MLDLRTRDATGYMVLVTAAGVSPEQACAAVRAALGPDGESPVEVRLADDTLVVLEVSAAADAARLEKELAGRLGVDPRRVVVREGSFRALFAGGGETYTRMAYREETRGLARPDDSRVAFFERVVPEVSARGRRAGYGTIAIEPGRDLFRGPDAVPDPAPDRTHGPRGMSIPPVSPLKAYGFVRVAGAGVDVLGELACKALPPGVGVEHASGRALLFSVPGGDWSAAVRLAREVCARLGLPPAALEMYAAGAYEELMRALVRGEAGPPPAAAQ